ncbi:LAQU0S20e01200g1_1 [Lachancea quebecensis]|uniref:LAQU0S20e01200g1_1 n=1 Tax=Lachancea quebecensis TaxID=1654605 RepID=A0A0N7MME1_9SACH|nr:LAQU0S20e01200g1_1 [Lachancea quebecensis]
MDNRVFAAIFVPVLVVSLLVTAAFWLRSRLGFSDSYRLDVSVYQRQGDPDLEDFSHCTSLLKITEAVKSEVDIDFQDKPKTLSLNAFCEIFPTTQYGSFREQYPVDDQESCVICQEQLNDLNNVRVLGCSHVFHTHCIDRWVCGNSACCPLCKRSYSLPVGSCHVIAYIEKSLGPGYNVNSSIISKANTWLGVYPDLQEFADQKLTRYSSKAWKAALIFCLVKKSKLKGIIIVREGHRRYELMMAVEEIHMETLRNELRTPIHTLPKQQI